MPSFVTERDALLFAVDMVFMIIGTTKEENVRELFFSQLPKDLVARLTKTESVNAVQAPHDLFGNRYPVEPVYMLDTIEKHEVKEPETFMTLEEDFMKEIPVSVCRKILQAYNSAVLDTRGKRDERMDAIEVAILKQVDEEEAESKITELAAVLPAAKLAKLLGR